MKVNLPQKPGVYLFKDKKGQVIYIGKAINLKDRVKNYFSPAPSNARILEMIRRVKDIDYALTRSEFEALLLEAALIKKLKPKFNVRLKDDKHFLYIKITTGKEFPKVVTSRREDDKKATYFGPFPSAKKTREVLKILRRIFPFCSQKTLGKRACFFSHLGLCDPCPSNIIKLKGKRQNGARRKYQGNIAQIIRILKGGSKRVIKDLEREMKRKAQEEKFEEAAKLRDRILKLKYISEPREKVSTYLEDFDFLEKKWKKELDTLFKFLVQNIGKRAPYPQRIEGYDISNIYGRWATGAMVVFVDGDEERGDYRRFRIKFKETPDDFLMLKEVLERRFAHPEWEFPQLILVDGGKPQISAAVQVLLERGLKIPVLGLAKKMEEIVIPTNFLTSHVRAQNFKVLRLPQNSPVLNVLKRVRDEAHRFARSYHLKLRLKNLLSEKLKENFCYDKL